jgi:hypothetical protein
MGHCKKILASETIPSIPRFLSNQMVVEIAENFHFHYRNYRMELDSEEFEKIALAFIESYSRWNLMGRKKSVRYKYAGDKNIVLSKSEISPLPSLSNSETSVNNFRVELQKYADYIHIHYKEFRFEFTLSEFQTFAKVIQDAQEDLGRELSKAESPRRVGFFNRSVPFGRVDDTKNLNYWLYPEDVDSENIFESTYSSDEKSLIVNRETNKPYLYKIHIDDLYISTLHYKGINSPWGVGESNVFLPLQNRLEFVKLFLTNDFKLTEDQIKSSSYYELLCEGFDKTPRDGESNEIYLEPLTQCKRFIKLIKSVFKNGYGSIDISMDEFSPALMRNITGETKIQNTRNDLPDDTISFYLVAGLPQVHNGLHRIAILKHMYDENLLDDPLILVIHLNKKPISQSDFRQIKFDHEGFPVGNLHYREYRFKQIINESITKIIGLISFISTFLIIILQETMAFEFTLEEFN